MDGWRAVSRWMNGVGWHSPTQFSSETVGLSLWFWLIARCSMGCVAPFGLLLPVSALISSVLLLGDRMTPRLIVDGLLAILGVAITQVTPSARSI
jgi:O-acetylserine/cysteine efflux transporter